MAPYYANMHSNDAHHLAIDLSLLARWVIKRFVQVPTRVTRRGHSLQGLYSMNSSRVSQSVITRIQVKPAGMIGITSTSTNGKRINIMIPTPTPGQKQVGIRSKLHAVIRQAGYSYHFADARHGNNLVSWYEYGTGSLVWGSSWFLMVAHPRGRLTASSAPHLPHKCWTYEYEYSILVLVRVMGVPRAGSCTRIHIQPHRVR